MTKEMKMAILTRAAFYTLALIDEADAKNTIEFRRENGVDNIHSRTVERYWREYAEIKREIKKLQNIDKK